MGKKLLMALAVIVASVIGAGLVAGAVAINRHNAKERAAAIADFQQDLGTQVDFTLVKPTRALPNPRIEQEEGRQVIEASIVVRGCELEAERVFGEQAVDAMRQQRRIERYVLDEGVGPKRQEIPMPGAPVTALGADVVRYLATGPAKSRFVFCLKLTPQDKTALGLAG